MERGNSRSGNFRGLLTSECRLYFCRVRIFHIISVSFLPLNIFCYLICEQLFPALISVYLAEHPVGTCLFLLKEVY